MSLNFDKLEAARELAGGIVQARCPACAEDGHDRSGQHLRIYPDGRFGCCVHPKDKEHRKRIFALAESKSRRSGTGTFGLRLKTSSEKTPIESVKVDLTAFNAGTLGTPISDLVSSGQTTPQLSPAVIAIADHQPDLLCKDFRTDGTACFNPRAYESEKAPNIIDAYAHTYKDRESAVLSVSCGFEDKAGLPPVSDPGKQSSLRLPFLTAGGDLSIPFDSPLHYHWWRGGQSVAVTRRELATSNIQQTSNYEAKKGHDAIAV